MTIFNLLLKGKNANNVALVECLSTAIVKCLMSSSNCCFHISAVVRLVQRLKV